MPLGRHHGRIRLVPERRWQFWRRATSDCQPDDDERPYRPLAHCDPVEADRLTCRFVEQWLASASIPPLRAADAFAATRLDVAGEPDAGNSTLRLTFDHLGTKSYLYDWNGDSASAEEFIDQLAQQHAMDVECERRKFGSTDWDDR